MKILKIYLFTFSHCYSLEAVVFCRQKIKNLPKANEEYAAKNFGDAEAEYRISNSNP
jgi:hypothetical protein